MSTSQYQEPAWSSNIRVILIPLIIALVTAAAYSQIINSGFISFDDPVYVSENHHIQGGLSIESVRWAVTTTRDGNWFPLTWLSYLLDISIAGSDARTFHTANLLYHLVNSSLLFTLLYMMTGSINRSALVAALFALHPLHVESVAWISERKDLLSTLFLFLTIISYIKFRERPGIRRYLATLSLFACGLMSKSMLVSAPLILLLLDYWPLAKMPTIHYKSAKALLLEKAPFFTMAIASGVLTYSLQKHKAVVSLDVSPLVSNLGNAAVSYVLYIHKTFIPTGLSVMYPFPSKSSLYLITGAIFILAAVSAVVLVRRRSEPYLLVGWFWYLFSLLPVIGIIQVGKQSMADRYTYIPLVGFFIMLVWGAAELHVLQRLRTKVKAIIVIGIFSTLAVLTWNRVACWSSSISLFSQAVAVTENNWFAFGVLGYDYLNHNEFDTAHAMLSRSLSINPENVMALYNMGVLHNRLGNRDLALQYFYKSVYFEPEHGMAHYQIGMQLAARGDAKGALREYTIIKEHKELDPEVPRQLLHALHIL